MIQMAKDCGLYDKLLQVGSSRWSSMLTSTVCHSRASSIACVTSFIVDSKSSRSVEKFRYDVNSFSYDIQAYIYTKVFGIKDYYWVVQEKTYPFYLPTSSVQMRPCSRVR